jgi:DNA topoisomerase-1
MRTDSTTLSDQAIRAARNSVESLYDASYLSPEVRQYQTRVKNAQEAHEAIRPAGEVFRTPDQVAGELQVDELRLYDLIWKRTLACQMADAKGRRLTAKLAAENAVFQASGKVIDFAGFLRVYAEQADDADDANDQERILPPMQEGDKLGCKKLEAKEHRTLPPARFTEASLVKELEANGIGRPSTYASIIETIQRREYTFKEGSALVPTFLAFAVVNLLRKHFPDLVDTGFTARMEDDLDAISRGEAESLAHLQAFYFGDGMPGLRDQLDAKVNNIDPRDVCSIPLGEDQGQPVVVRVGRYGPFLQRGEDTAPIPDGIQPDQLTLARSIEILALPRGPQELGTDPETGEKVYVREGRFGPYVQLGEMDDSKAKPKTQSLLKGMRSDTVDLETALKLLRLPRLVGTDPNGVEIQAFYGRYGAYIKRGEDTRSLDDEQKLFTLTVGEALEVLAQPKRGRRRGSEPLHQLGKSPDLDAEVRVMQGPYGPYVTDGKTNASVPKGTEPAQVTLAQAVELIKERMARGPSTRKRGGRRPSAGARKAAPARTAARSTKGTTRKTSRRRSAEA